MPWHDGNFNYLGMMKTRDCYGKLTTDWQFQRQFSNKNNYV